MKVKSLPPIGSAQPQILILGSMPSAASLLAGEYYAHPRNAFWDIMGAVYAAGRDIPYSERVNILRAQHVAVWDVLQSCWREGSLDTAITDEAANDFTRFLNANTTVRHIFFNGTKAETAFRKHLIPKLDFTFPMTRLPSTSPAHARRNKDDKISIWRDALLSVSGQE